MCESVNGCMLYSQWDNDFYLITYYLIFYCLFLPHIILKLYYCVAISHWCLGLEIITLIKDHFL
uniref:Uncharacterized protein n=1 Tax=Rhizophora mucronata TaxID=61149 RepID=A0A2P2NP85_RHIMU